MIFLLCYKQLHHVIMTTLLKPLIAGEPFVPSLFQFLRHCVKNSKTPKHVWMGRDKSSVRSVFTLVKFSWEISTHFVITERDLCLQTLVAVLKLRTV